MSLNKAKGKEVQEAVRGRRLAPLTLLPALLLLLTVGCSSNMTLQAMGNSAYYRPLAPSDMFPDGQSARPDLPDTVARGHVQDDTLLNTGKVDNKDADLFPFPITKDVLLRGQERFNIYCAPCHGAAGQGNGMVVQRGFSAPPSFHIDRLRTSPAGHFFDVITNGFGRMPSYGMQVPVRDRWAIIAYIRALQLSQNATVNDVPADQRTTLGGQ